LETYASENAISATLSQQDRPVPFFSRTLNSNERRHVSVEKEALSIVEAVRKWAHLLTGRHFKIVTDQRSVAFMYDNNNHGKINNDEVLRRRMELSEFDCDIVYRSGKLNAAPDALSRVYCAAMRENTLYNTHVSLCHPGITRLNHYVRAKNLPYSVDDLRKVVHDCTACAGVKPNFYKLPDAQLVKAIQPFERLSLDFKGPLPSSTNNHYMLTVVDEYLRFPFAFPCRSTDAETVISCLNQLLTLYGMPAYVHSDRGPAFVSHDLISYLHHRGIGCSNTSIYNPRSNGQCERYNGIIWSSVKLALKSRKLHISQWELVLPDVLHSIRLLLCTTANETPHEKFV